MFIQFKWGSTWQLIGSDAYDATVGAGPVGIAYSEWALANPSAWAYHRPMLEESRGKAAFITTPRGNNHAKDDARHGEGEPALVRRGAERRGHRRAVAGAARRGAGRVSGALRHRLRPRLLRAGVPLQLLRRDGRRLLRGRDGAGRARGPGGRGAGRRASSGAHGLGPGARGEQSDLVLPGRSAASCGSSTSTSPRARTSRSGSAG